MEICISAEQYFWSIDVLAIESNINTDTSEEDQHVLFMKLALSEAKKCIPTPTAFCVGCVLTCRWPDEDSPMAVLSTGYSRELPGNTHAEANALAKARQLRADELASLLTGVSYEELPSIEDLLHRSDVYTTLEPCSIRTSGLAPCADALIAAQVQRCVIGVGEPDDFVKCEGATKLIGAGIKVVWLKGFEGDCLQVARTGHDTSSGF